MNFLNHKSFLQELNKLRKEPQSVIESLKERQIRYRRVGNHICLLSRASNKKAIKIYQTESPSQRIESLISEIMEEEIQMKQVVQSEQLNEIAKLVLAEMQMNEFQKLDFDEEKIAIIKRQLKGNKQFGQQVFCMVQICFNEGPRQVLLSFLVDDDVQNRSNRIILTDPDIKCVGYSEMEVTGKEHMMCAVIVAAKDDELGQIQQKCPSVGEGRKQAGQNDEQNILL